MKNDYDSIDKTPFDELPRESLIAALVEKDKIISQQRATLRALSLAPAVPTALRYLITRARGVTRPRLGRLYHHPPRPMRRITDDVARNTIRWPGIGMVTPSFQQGRFIKDTIRSVHDQHYPLLQHFVQDGGSTDETVDVLRSFEGQLAGWESCPDAGQGDALNRGFRRIDAEIMAYLNSDDLLLPGSLHIVGRFFAKYPEIDVVYGDRLIIDENGMEIGDWRLPSHDNEVLSWADFIPQETLFWRRSAWEKAGGKIDDNMKFAVDWDLILRMRDTGAKFHHIRRYIGAFRVHTQSKTIAQAETVGRKEMDMLRRRSLGYVPSDQQISSAIRPYLKAHLLVDFLPRIAEKVRRRVLIRS